MNQEDRPHKPLPEEPLTLEEINKHLDLRVDKIEKEFEDGFNFIKTYSKSVTFFGSARTLETEGDYIKTRNLAKRISEELGYTIVTGGGPGVMEAANRGAMDAKGESLGLTIKLPKEQVTNPYLTKEQQFYYFFSRKVCMSFAAEAYIFCPGGFGTLDELFEILTLVQTGKIENVPVILYGADYWNSLDKLIKEKLLSGEKISEKDLKLYTITDDENEILEIVKKAPIRKGME